MTTIRFAANDDEAKDRFDRNSNPDPFPEIPPALLNSADIFDYVRTTGMIFPFDPTPERLKSASYEVPFLGLVIYWDDGKRSERQIENGTTFPLKKNSIAFVWLDTTFRLPDYIALRFNFRITHVHRGLLLGTGPLIDPGFAGRILIPVHNLTSEDYELVGGQGLIWVEFTKISPNTLWDAKSDRSGENFHGFPPEKRYQQPHYYFEKASHNQPIQSSIPGEVKKAKDDAEAAKNSAKGAEEYVATMRRWIYWGGGLAILALIVGIASALVGVFTLVSNTNARLDSIMSRLITLETKSDAKPSAGDTLHPMESDSGQRSQANLESKADAKPSAESTTHPIESDSVIRRPANDAAKDRVYQDQKRQQH